MAAHGRVCGELPIRPTFSISIVSKQMCAAWKKYKHPGCKKPAKGKYTFSFLKAVHMVQDTQRHAQEPVSSIAYIRKAIVAFKEEQDLLQSCIKYKLEKPTNNNKFKMLSEILEWYRNKKAMAKRDKTAKKAMATGGMSPRVTNPPTNAALLIPLKAFTYALSHYNLTMLEPEQLLSPKVLSKTSEIMQVPL